MLKGIDISNWQKGFSITTTKPGFVIVKATEGLRIVDKCCDGFVQQCLAAGIPFGYYHFARPNDAAREAKYFYDNTKGYVGKGIPILDFEDTRCTNAWMETWMKTFHELSGIWPWVYMNSDFINNRGYGTSYVKQHCGLWLAGYPSRMTVYPAGSECPYKHSGWTLAAWQFTDNLAIGGMHVDGDFFYGDKAAWSAYATAGSAQKGQTAQSTQSTQSGAATSATMLSGASDWQLARRVINGEFGNGQARRNVLGSRYGSVQAKVNSLLNGSDRDLAKAVIRGELGNGQTRKNILGSRYNAVQKVVNSML